MALLCDRLSMARQAIWVLQDLPRLGRRSLVVCLLRSVSLLRWRRRRRFLLLSLSLEDCRMLEALGVLRMDRLTWQLGMHLRLLMPGWGRLRVVLLRSLQNLRGKVLSGHARVLRLALRHLVQMSQRMLSVGHGFRLMRRRWGTGVINLSWRRRGERVMFRPNVQG